MKSTAKSVTRPTIINDTYRTPMPPTSTPRIAGGLIRKLDWQSLNEDDDLDDACEVSGITACIDSSIGIPDEASLDSFVERSALFSHAPAIPAPASKPPLSIRELVPPIIEDDVSRSASLISDVFASFSIFDEEEPELVELEMKRPGGSPSRTTVNVAPSLSRSRDNQQDIKRSNNPMSITLHELEQTDSGAAINTSEKWRPIQVTNLCFSKGAFRVFDTKGKK